VTGRLPAALRLVHRGLPPIFCAIALAACGSGPSPKRGAYYQGDGPPDRTPADLEATPDATPRVEPLLARANRPYTALGRTYTPLTSDVPFRQRGIASWYGRQFHGNRTASGEIYDMFAMTAAHPTLPIPSYVRVSSTRNGTSVIVRVNDRGPFKDDRVIDLSYGAATKLGIAGTGTGEVEIERLTFAQIASGDWRRGSPQAAQETQDTLSRPPANPAAAPVPVGRAVVAADARTGPDPVAIGEPRALPPAPAPAPGANGSRWSVQVGAFAQQSNAEAFASRIDTVLGQSEGGLAAAQREARVERDAGLFRVLVGILPDRASAQSLAVQLERLLGQPVLPLLR
jgi:rare lipoprotein A